MSEPRLEGEVVSYGDDRGFGFIRTADGTEYFVRFTEILGDGYRSLRAGQRVSFIPRCESPGGELQASAVTVLEDAPPAGFDEQAERREFETRLREVVEALAMVHEPWEDVESVEVYPDVHEGRPIVAVAMRILGKPNRTYVAPCGFSNLPSLGADLSAGVAITSIEEDLRSLARGAPDADVPLRVDWD